MCNIEKSYKAFHLTLESGLASGNPAASFREVCRKLKVSPADLEEIIMDELGMSGEEVVAMYRSGFGQQSGQPHEIFNAQSFRPQVKNGVGKDS